jgi:dihydrofolate synthase / folylpolyglutamate synthase
MVKKLDILEKFINNESHGDYRSYDLAGMAALMKLAGNPHNGLRCVHIAGTNGKGSVACMLARIFAASGLSCGLYVSPHLEDINERISINGVLISDNDLAACASRIEGLIAAGGLAPTFFDILTAIAFQYFRGTACDISVIETGLGGKRDSTNLVAPLCSVITEISIDHTHILGGTIEEIAAEKAGIIKHGVPVVTAASPGPALDVIEKEAAEKRSPVFAVGRDILISHVTKAPAGRNFSLTLPGGIEVPDIYLPLPGEHQVRNAAAAAAAAAIAGSTIHSVTPHTIRAALGSVAVPGRMEQLSSRPAIVFDPAHNPGAMEALISTIAEEYPGSSPLFVVSLMADKDYSGIWRIFREHGIRPVYYNLDDIRARRVRPGDDSLVDGVFDSPEGISGLIASRYESSGPVVFCGSFRLYTAARECAARFTGRR